MIAFNLGDRCTYNISTNRETSVNEIFTLLSKELNYINSAIYKDKRPGEIRHISLTNHKANIEMGWSPKISIEDGVKKIVQYYIHGGHNEH